mmetsp:Transcript_16437/g.41537  ORF Transcript_16437/g.41537 Transcript_16437/m.41537 type:complete len:214 (-) Transcript_16437:810-1451(-)
MMRRYPIASRAVKPWCFIMCTAIRVPVRPRPARQWMATGQSIESTRSRKRLTMSAEGVVQSWNSRSCTLMPARSKVPVSYVSASFRRTTALIPRRRNSSTYSAGSCWNAPHACPALRSCGPRKATNLGVMRWRLNARGSSYISYWATSKSSTGETPSHPRSAARLRPLMQDRGWRSNVDLPHVASRKPSKGVGPMRRKGYRASSGDMLWSNMR